MVIQKVSAYSEAWGMLQGRASHDKIERVITGIEVSMRLSNNICMMYEIVNLA